MSKESAGAFLSQVETDNALQQKLQSLGTGASIEDVLDVAAAQGYNFNSDDLIEAGRSRAETMGAGPEGELSDTELEQVTGGKLELRLSRFFITTDTATIIVKK
jgi:predicted ribosomally synthesized peptide with nif11-like leader